MNKLQFPAMRREVMDSLAALSDVEYQERVWIKQQYPHPGYFDNVQARISTLYDDCQVLPEPEEALWTVVLPGDEVDRLRAVDVALEPLVDELGVAPDAVYLADSRWRLVTSAAGKALASMVLAGGYWNHQEDDSASPTSVRAHSHARPQTHDRTYRAADDGGETPRRYQAN